MYKNNFVASAGVFDQQPPISNNQRAAEVVLEFFHIFTVYLISNNRSLFYISLSLSVLFYFGNCKINKYRNHGVNHSLNAGGFGVREFARKFSPSILNSKDIVVFGENQSPF